LLVKVNQIGSLTETIEALKPAIATVGVQSPLTAPVKRKIPPSPIWQWLSIPDKSKRVPPPVPTGWQNTTSYCEFEQRTWRKASYAGWSALKAHNKKKRTATFSLSFFEYLSTLFIGQSRKYLVKRSESCLISLPRFMPEAVIQIFSTKWQMSYHR
jgi:hypothetical protein